MQEPILRHSYVQLNGSFVHLLQYGCGENLVRSSTVSPNTSHINTTSSATSSNKTTTASTTKPATTARSILGSSNNSSIFNNAQNNKSNNVTNDCANGAGSGSTKTHLHQTKAFTRELIIFIPGNPGVLGVYHDFLMSVFRIINSSSTSENKNPNERPTILAIGHNNFDHPDHVQYKTEERICIKENELNFVERAVAEKYYDEPHHIELQVLNKLIILKKVLKCNLNDCKLIFIGHSIGCYVILRLIQDRLISTNHGGSILIHPALENLALTEKGQYFDRLFGYNIDLLMRSVAYILDQSLPKPIKLALVKWFCPRDFVQGSSDIVIESCMQLVCQKTLKAVIQMSKSEFALVKNLNHESLVKPHVEKLKLIYAIDDHWVNTDNRRLLKELYPDLYMEEQSTKHAFVMDTQTVMDYAVKVGMLLQDFIDYVE